MRRLPLAAFVFEARELLLKAGNLPLKGSLLALGAPSWPRYPMRLSRNWKTDGSSPAAGRLGV